jgi:FMN-dependent NADH-azoreductase
VKQILIIEVSPRGAASASRAVIEKLAARLREESPAARFVYRDLAEDGIPHMDHSTLKAISSKDQEEVRANKEAGRLSDALTEELLASDLLVIGTPMWNFGIPSLLKAWIDLVVRPGKTFAYTNPGCWDWQRVRRLSWWWLRAGSSLMGRGSRGISSTRIYGRF